MFRLVCFLACLALVKSHAVLPLVPPVVHAVPVPVVTPHLSHGYSGLGYGHGFFGKPLGHHILKRSPHYVPSPIEHVAHVAPLAVAPVVAAPLAVSHQARVDVRTSPAIIAAAPVVPVVKQVITPVVAAPFLHKPLAHFGLGHYGSGYGGHY